LDRARRRRGSRRPLLSKRATKGKTGETVGYGELQRGQGYVQFRLTSSANEDLLVADMNFQAVK
jgi:hypothetical protein